MYINALLFADKEKIQQSDNSFKNIYLWILWKVLNRNLNSDFIVNF